MRVETAKATVIILIIKKNIGNKIIKVMSRGHQRMLGRGNPAVISTRYEVAVHLVK